MVVSLNTAISKGYSGHSANSDIAFGNSKKNTVKFAPQASDELVLKGAKQAAHKNPLRNLARALMLTFGMGLAGTAITGCTPDDVPTPPVNPKDTTVVVDTTKTAEMNPLEKQFKRVMAPVLALDTTKAGAVDSVLVYDEGDGVNNGYKYNKQKSTADKLIFNRTSTLPDGTPAEYSIIEYTKDGDKISADVYHSKNFIYNDPEKFFGSTLKYSKDGSSTILDNAYRYIPKSVKESVRQLIEDPAYYCAIKRLF